MTSSTSILKTPRLLAEYRSDSRGLWLFAIVISVALHLMLGWAIVRLLLVEGKANAQAKQEVIPIETVAIAQRSAERPAPAPQPSPQTPASQTESTSPPSAKTASPTEPSPATPTPTRDRARSKSWRWYRPGARAQSQNSADTFVEERVESRSNDSQRTSQRRDRAHTQRRINSANGEPILNESAASSKANAPRSASRPGTQRRVSSANGEPIWNDSTSPSRSNSRASQGRVRRFSGAGSESLLGDASSSSGASSAAKSGDRGKGQSGSASKTPPSAPPASNSSQNRGVSASLGTPRLTRPDRDVPDKLATPKQNSQTLSVLPLGGRLSGAVVLDVVAVIEPDGKATVYQTKVLSGAIDRQKAEQLAKSIVEAWNFDPTLMAGQPVAQEYLIQLSLSPVVP